MLTKAACPMLSAEDLETLARLDHAPQAAVQLDLAADDAGSLKRFRRTAQHDRAHAVGLAPVNMRPAIGDTPGTSKIPAVTHWRETVRCCRRVPPSPCCRHRRKAGDGPSRGCALSSRACWRRSEAARLASVVSMSPGARRRTAAASSVAPTSAKMALLAPMPSASVSVDE